MEPNWLRFVFVEKDMEINHTIPMILARDLMTENPQFLLTQQKLSDAVAIFEKRQFSSIPIVGASKEVRGLLTELSLLRMIILSQGKEEKNPSFNEYESLLEPAQEVLETDPIADVVSAMLGARFHRLVVLDRKKNLVGMISPKDLILFMTSQKGRSRESIQMASERMSSELGFLREQNQSLVGANKNLEDFKAAMEQSPFLMHSVSKNGTIQYANQRMHTILGYKDGELIGQHFREIYPSHILSLAESSLKNIEKHGSFDVSYSALKAKDNSVVKVEMTSSAIYDSQGEFIGTSTLSRVVDSDLMLKLLHGVLKP